MTPAEYLYILTMARIALRNLRTRRLARRERAA